MEITSRVGEARRARPVGSVVRALGGLAVLAALIWQVGTGPFLDGVRAVDAATITTAAGIGLVTTACCAWRWRLVAAGLGARLPLGEAVGAYYQAQFLNSTLPGGVLGDVHRAVRHGSDLGDARLGARSVVIERLSGQAVQTALAVILLCLLPSPVRAYMPVVLAVMVAGAALLAGVGFAAGFGSSRLSSALRAAGSHVRDGLLAPRVPVGVIALTSVIMVGHLATFVLAARAAGVTADLVRLLPLTLLALQAMALPVSVAGWGPREGVAAWAFAAAGLTTEQGVAAAATFGILAFAASLPGAGVLVARWISRKVPDPVRVPAFGQGESHG